MSEIKTAYISGSKVIVFDGSPERIEFDLSEVPPELFPQMALGFAQRVARERTAGKVDSAEERKQAVSSIASMLEAWKSGSLSVERAGKVELTAEEVDAAILDFIVARKRASGDVRPESEIKALFSKLPKEKRETILTALKKPLNRFLKERLQAKRGAAKADW